MNLTLAEPDFHTELKTTPEMPDILVLHVRGRVTYQNASELRHRVLSEIEGTVATKLIVELDDVEQMDTAGAAVLVEAVMQGKDSDVEIMLCAPSESVLRIFCLAGLSDVLESCFSSPAELQKRLARLSR